MLRLLRVPKQSKLTVCVAYLLISRAPLGFCFLTLTTPSATSQTGPPGLHWTSWTTGLLVLLDWTWSWTGGGLEGGIGTGNGDGGMGTG